VQTGTRNVTGVAAIDQTHRDVVLLVDVAVGEAVFQRVLAPAEQRVGARGSRESAGESQERHESERSEVWRRHGADGCSKRRATKTRSKLRAISRKIGREDVTLAGSELSRATSTFGAMRGPSWQSRASSKH
jgi:hypothetical protein